MVLLATINEYSLNDGATYTEFGRVAENRMRYSQMTTDAMINAHTRNDRLSK